MFRVPQHVLDGLRCHLCNGYLSVKPILVRRENEQVCGKCYKTLSGEEKAGCLRQVGLENIAVLITFPCRYNVRGCPYTFKFNDQSRHEEECQYRYRTVASRDLIGTNVTVPAEKGSTNEIKFESEQINAICSYEIKENKYSKDIMNLTYTLDIRGNCDNTLIIKNTTNYESRPIRLSMEGLLLLGCSPESVFSNIKLVSLDAEDNIYDTLQTNLLPEALCVSCSAKIPNNLHYYCSIGHPSCFTCKDLMCIKCISIKEKESNGFCKNFSRGCFEVVQQDQQSKHEVDCEFNDYKCPFDTCRASDILRNIKDHLMADHEDSTYSTSEVTKTFGQKDETFVVLCYESIFKCVYYYYKSFMEIFVTHIGTAKRAKCYKYEVTVTTHDGPLTRRAKCCSWNDDSLEQGISFEKKMLVSLTKRPSFEIKLKIIHVN